MIIYGINWSKQRVIPTRETCPLCGAIHSVSLIYQYQYAHVYGIPLFPTKKDIKGYCSACEEGINYQSIKNNTTQYSVRFPIMSFIGLIIIVLTIAGIASYTYIDNIQTKKLSIEYINDPKEGDIYEVKFGDKEYGLMRISGFEGDSIMMQTGEYVIDRRSGIKDLKTGEYKNKFYEERFGYTKEELLQILEEETILKVSRKEE